MRHRLSFLTLLLLFFLLAVSRSFAEQGQYRSKILLTPAGEIGQGAELSIEELEQQIDSIEQPYARSSAGRHLARHYVEQGDYDKAIAYYREALLAEGLSAVANREMLRELAQVYLLQKDYAAAAQALEQVLAIDLLPETTDFLLLAQANYHLRNYVAVVAALDKIEQSGLTLDPAQLGQALALYYQAGAFAQSERILQRLLEVEPNEPRHWHLLASVYLQQDKKRQALDQLTLARRKGVAFSDDDILLLADLYAVNQNPYDAADTLRAALQRQELEGNGANYRKLFEFWFQAREPAKARQALSQAAKLSGDTELYLYLAQLQMEERDWAAMQQTMLSACGQQLQDRFVGRANLLLGVSQLKLGDDAGARRSFINATLIGGVNAQAAQWLKFMDAAPATQAELRRIVGICYGASDKRLKSAGVAPGAEGVAGMAGEDADSWSELQTKTVPPVHLFTAQYREPLEELVSALRSRLVKMNISLVKSGGAVEGPVHLLFSGDPAAQSPGEGTWRIGLPTSASVSGKGRFRSRSEGAFKCAYMTFAGAAEELPAAMQDLATAVAASEYTATGDVRVLLMQGSSEKNPRLELQIGIR